MIMIESVGMLLDGGEALLPTSTATGTTPTFEGSANALRQSSDRLKLQAEGDCCLRFPNYATAG
jgi:hypothetical protein